MYMHFFLCYNMWLLVFLGRMNNPFADPNLEARLSVDPKCREYLKDPSFMFALNQLKADPSKLSMYVSIEY